jgi:hypothetical protein
MTKTNIKNKRPARIRGTEPGREENITTSTRGVQTTSDRNAAERGLNPRKTRTTSKVGKQNRELVMALLASVASVSGAGKLAVTKGV